MLTIPDNDSSREGLRPAIEARRDGSTLALSLSGDWVTSLIAPLDAELRKFGREGGDRALQIDLRKIRLIDTAGAWLIKRLIVERERAGAQVSVVGDDGAKSTLLQAVDDAARLQPEQPRPSDPRLTRLLAGIGHGVYRMRDDFLLGMHILGSTIAGAQMKHGRGHGVNFAAIASQIDRMGIGAMPVVVLMSSIVGAIVAQQGAFQLRYFGAEIFVVDLVGILVLREMGVLLTAIMIAGRSGSAITAEIGSMKMREEVDALKVIGLNPVGVLVFPRLVALMIALPCLTIIANFAAIGGAIAVTWVYSGINPVSFVDRMHEAIDLSSLLAGLIKAPFMAIIIGVIASVEGMKVGGSAESLGRHVTASVVKAIFVVIVVDGLFAMFYAAIDF